jgi:transcriptional regulator with XRE-family HTH domain
MRPMSTTSSVPKAQSTELGALLRTWRETRGVSQLDLSLDAGISQRHISFIESRRSVPGRQTLLNLAQSLDVPLRERNALLLSAGYAPIYSEAGWNAEEMSSISNGLVRILRQQEPLPAVVTDRCWNVLMANQAYLRFFDMQAVRGRTISCT